MDGNGSHARGLQAVDDDAVESLHRAVDRRDGGRIMASVGRRNAVLGGVDVAEAATAVDDD